MTGNIAKDDTFFWSQNVAYTFECVCIISGLACLLCKSLAKMKIKIPTVTALKYTCKMVKQFKCIRTEKWRDVCHKKCPNSSIISVFGGATHGKIAIRVYIQLLHITSIRFHIHMMSIFFVRNWYGCRVFLGCLKSKKMLQVDMKTVNRIETNS